MPVTGRQSRSFIN